MGLKFLLCIVFISIGAYAASLGKKSSYNKEKPYEKIILLITGIGTMVVGILYLIDLAYYFLK